MSAIVGSVGKVVWGMVTSLLTEKYLKILIVRGLRVLVKKTATVEDDQILKVAEEAWGVQD